MKINISENTANSIIKVLNEYLSLKLLDDDDYSHKIFYLKEDVELMIEASKSLGELQGAVRAVKDLEESNRKIKEDYPALDTSIADFINDRINEVALKGLENENISD